jgi:hypothetical protein
MTLYELSHAAWRTSSHSGVNGDCVEVARQTEAVAVRDSKDRAGPVLVIGPAGWEAFTAQIKAGALGW